MFLDYCHLTREGIAVAMAATAAELARPPTEKGTGDWRHWLAAAPEAPPEVDAIAQLGAAIHTAHRLTGAPVKRELVEHWCERALRSWPPLTATLEALVQARAALLPEWLTAAQQVTLAAPATLGFQHGWRWDAVDGLLLRAVGRALAARGGEPVAGGRIERALVSLAPLPGQAIELAVPGRFLAEPVERFYPEAMSEDGRAGRALLRCVWPQSSFDLPWNGAARLALTLVARLPTIPGAEGELEGALAVVLNERQLAEVRLSRRWSRCRIELPLEFLCAGLNRLTLRWPMPPEADRAALAAAGERLENGIEADLHPLFGEVYSLRVESVTGSVSPPSSTAGP
jgi:hypothetical protein